MANNSRLFALRCLCDKFNYCAGFIDFICEILLMRGGLFAGYMQGMQVYVLACIMHERENKQKIQIKMGH
jgi:hypothetical protein